MAKTKTKKLKLIPLQQLWLLAILALAFGVVIYYARQAMTVQHAEEQLHSFRADPLSKVRILAKPKIATGGLTPQIVKDAYHLPGDHTGSGTIAIVNAYDNPRAEQDLGVFNKQFSLRGCTTANGCFEKHKMISNLGANRDWALESSLDVQWAHAIAPTAKILLVEARSNSGTDLLAAVSYAKARSDVVAISLSWGGDEFSSEAVFDSRFETRDGVSIFAASGDTGTGVIWPSVSPNVIAVGGTTLRTSDGSFSSETAWSGSGGGQSAYEDSPSYQDDFGVPSAGGKRAVPDISYNANPSTGFPVYDSLGYGGSRGWFVVGGTSAGSPQWAAIHARGVSVSHQSLYHDGANSPGDYFRDITSGNNGSCGTYCNATAGYDYVTGLGSPLTINF